MKTCQKYGDLASRAESNDLYEQLKHFCDLRVDTFPDYRNVINNQGQRGSSDIDIGGGDSGDTCCWSPPPLIYVSRGSAMDICIRSPLPRFLDNRVVLLPIWKLP